MKVLTTTTTKTMIPALEGLEKVFLICLRPRGVWEKQCRDRPSLFTAHADQSYSTHAH